MLKEDWIQSRVTLFNLHLGATIVAVIAMTSGFVCVGPLQAQERVRTSAGKLTIQSFRNPEVFFHIGPFQEEVTGAAGIEYTDNANLTNTDKTSRFRFYQALNLDTTWFLSHLNKLELNFTGQLNEDFLSNGKNQLNGSISASGIQFQFVISNFQVRVFDAFSYVQNPSTNPTATNTTNLNSLTNTIGA